jgi:hypothetical protein
MTTLYLSMSANERDLEIEDDLAKGMFGFQRNDLWETANFLCSPEDTARPQVEDFFPIKEEFRVGEGCQISRLANSAVDPESNGIGGGKHS